jgi:hypothetical protein
MELITCITDIILNNVCDTKLMVPQEESGLDQFYWSEIGDVLVFLGMLQNHTGVIG